MDESLCQGGRSGSLAVKVAATLVDRHCGLVQSLVRHIGPFFLFHRIQSRIGSPVSPQHTGSSRTVRRYPANNGQLTSNALPNGNGHEQSRPGPHAVSQEDTLSAKGKVCRAVTLLGLLIGVMGKGNTLTGDSPETMDSQDCAAQWNEKGRSAWALLGLAKKGALLKENTSGKQNADGLRQEPGDMTIASQRC